jgi:putative membrane protein
VIIVDMVLASVDRIAQFGTQLYTDCPGYGPWGYGHMGYYGYGGHFMGILIIILLIAVIYLAVRNTHIRRHGSALVDNPLDILKKRYAKGEITKDQYEAMKQDLKD